MKTESPINRLERELWYGCVRELAADGMENAERWQNNPLDYIREGFFIEPMPDSMKPLVEEALIRWEELEGKVLSRIKKTREQFLEEFEKARDSYLSGTDEWKKFALWYGNIVYGVVVNMNIVNLFAWILPKADPSRYEEYCSVGRMVTAIFYTELLYKELETGLLKAGVNEKGLRKIEARWTFVNELVYTGYEGRSNNGNQLTRGYDKMNSLFSRLFKYSESENLSPLENFTTELLAYVLKYDEIYKYIFGCSMNNDEEITTQAGLDGSGRADILITNYQDKCFIIENKIEAGFQTDQLLKYKKYAQEKYKENKVIVITKYSCEFNDNIGKPDKVLSWLEVSEELKNVALHNDDKILHEFIKFLEEEKMALNKVNSLNEKQHFVDMIEIALDQLQDPNLLRPHKSTSTQYKSFNYYYKGDVYISIIFIYSEAILYILIHDFEYKYKNTFPRHDKWPVNALVSSFDLNSKDFFTLSSSQQFDEIKTFLKDSLYEVKSKCMGGD